MYKVGPPDPSGSSGVAVAAMEVEVCGVVGTGVPGASEDGFGGPGVKAGCIGGKGGSPREPSAEPASLKTVASRSRSSGIVATESMSRRFRSSRGGREDEDKRKEENRDMEKARKERRSGFYKVLICLYR